MSEMVPIPPQISPLHRPAVWKQAKGSTNLTRMSITLYWEITPSLFYREYSDQESGIREDRAALPETPCFSVCKRPQFQVRQWHVPT